MKASLLLPTLFSLSALLGDAQGAGIQFERVGGDQTGLAAALEAWHAEEVRQQGGSLKSHGWWPWGIRAIDYDGDGDWDLLVSHHGIPRSRLFRNHLAEEGKLRFSDVSERLLPPKAQRPAADDRPWVWDFDGDGYLDIASLTDEGQTPILFNQQGAGFKPGPESFTRHNLSHPVEVIDLNGDGYPDLDGGRKGLFFYQPKQRDFSHQANPRFGEPAGLPPSLRNLKQKVIASSSANNRFLSMRYYQHFINGHDTLGRDPDPIDLNGDGTADLIIQGRAAYGGDYLGRYALGTAEGVFQDISEQTNLPLTHATPIYYGDLDGDGSPDLMLAGRQGGVFLNDGKARFRRIDGDMEAFLQDRGPYLLRAFRGDFDQDGDLDFLMSNPRRNFSRVYENQGQGSFQEVMTLPGWDANSNLVIDMDGDGDLDIVSGGRGGHNSRSIDIYLNQSKDAGNAALILPRMAAPNPYGVGAVVSIYRSGTVEGGRPLHRQKAHPDGQPVHFGLGAASTYDLVLEFPNGRRVVKQGLPANQPLEIRDTDEGDP